MKMKCFPLYLFVMCVTAWAQTPAPPAGYSQSAANVPTVSVAPDLDRLQAAASQTAIDLGHLRIDKWKVDGESKRQAQANADSMQRNLTSALPGLISAVRAAPQDLSAEFKLYRNLNALYDVFVSLTEAAGAFGPRNDYEALSHQLETMDSVRHNLGDTIERLTSSTQSELSQLRSQVRAYQQTAATAPPPKKVVVDDTEPPKKPAHKKKKPAATGNGSPSGATSPKSQAATDTGASAPKL
jgi:hypothetical protein